MPLVILLWSGAVASALLLPLRWLFAASLLAGLAWMGALREDPAMALFGALAVAMTPWMIALQRFQERRLIEHLEHEENEHMLQLSRSAQGLLQSQQAVHHLEEKIRALTGLYYVTQETSQSLSVDGLFARLSRVLPEMLPSPVVRLLTVHGGQMIAFEARYGKDGAPTITKQSSLSDDDLLMVRSARKFDLGKGEAPIQRTHKEDRVWIPLWSKKDLVGIFAVADLNPESEALFRIIAGQLTLQLSRIFLYEEVQALATTDDLTGVYVRRHFEGLARRELQRCARHGLASSLLMVDLDYFKMKNDTFGHLVGDVVLREVATILKSNLRDFDLIGRYGGEEFVILLIESPPGHSEPVAERLRQLVEVHPIRAYDELISQTISAGLAGFPEHGADYDALVEAADKALYAAKNQGRNRVVVAGTGSGP